MTLGPAASEGTDVALRAAAIASTWRLRSATKFFRMSFVAHGVVGGAGVAEEGSGMRGWCPEQALPPACNPKRPGDGSKSGGECGDKDTLHAKSYGKNSSVATIRSLQVKRSEANPVVNVEKKDALHGAKIRR
ncbi:hypothetical protein NDU88_006508 [Pleurodeles waltl]|uniref:Uncharacterized protein n=1 Tax=Pleurodeles waltl TaxID=8319 RepID=A0AAV7QNS6_PLEWA|nr:hypothetical protein NDU88_006508 [Pleurodeles waltl]